MPVTKTAVTGQIRALPRTERDLPRLAAPSAAGASRKSTAAWPSRNCCVRGPSALWGQWPDAPYLDRLQKTVESLPANEDEFVAEMMSEVDTTQFVAADYELA